MDQNTDLNIYDQKGRSEIERMNFKAAVVCYSRAIHLNKDDIPSLDGMGEALYHQKKYKEASLPLKKAVMMKPNDAQAYFNLAVMLEKLGKVDQTCETYKEVIRLDPTDSEGHFNLAVLLAAREKYEEAQEHYLKVSELRPSNAYLVENGIGCLYFNQGMLSKAIEKFQKSINLYDKYPLPYCNMSLVLFCEEKSEEALKYFEDGMKTLENEESKVMMIERIIESYADLKTRMETKLNPSEQFAIMIAGLGEIINLLTQQQQQK